MRLTRRFLILSILAATLAFPVTAFLCGTERWNVKVCQDQHVKYLFKDQSITSGKLISAQPTTIAKLQSVPWPFGDRIHPPKWSWDLRSTADVEYRIWVVTATLTKKKNESDEDYHLILKKGVRTLVAEIPAPGCVEDTPEPLKSMIIQARNDFDEWQATQSGATFNQKVRVTGVGMFDTLGHAEGTSPNGIELHPVIKIEFLD
jgi:hypothetical protein